MKEERHTRTIYMHNKLQWTTVPFPGLSLVWEWDNKAHLSFQGMEVVTKRTWYYMVHMYVP